ncbi:type VI secretion system secreted protein VgrG [Variovorax paradoxus]|uniref:type VI secretion system Vgr family protein n=1 Tax=Variovorax paradoxus TaxID=34073 RepID=UPI00339AEA34
MNDRLLFRAMSGEERISTLFEYRVRLVGDAAVSAKAMLGQDMSVEVNLASASGDSGARFVSGQVTQFSYVGKDDGDMHVHEAVLRPWLWYASRRSNFKIFQFRTVPEILQEVLAPYGFDIDVKLVGSYRNWDYCVQYGETDFNFVSRLMELEGIYYFFSHRKGSHSLVLCDAMDSHANLPAGPARIPYHAGVLAAQIPEQDFIDTLSHSEDIASGHFAADDYDFMKPNAEIDTLRQSPAGHSRDSYEMYEWPGGYTEVGDGENYARVRVEQQAARRELLQGRGNLRHMAPGYFFELTRHPLEAENRRHLIEAVTCDFQENALRTDGADGAAYAEATGNTSYRQTFEVLPDSAIYRTPRVTPKPRTTGPQTAVVVGPAGEEIYTDQYGRIKVQFQWDRYGKMDENSSCWIRVSQTWAGGNFGTMHVPRIGQEVIVDFINGDPDRPIVTGRVYNAMQMPPWDLPANKTQSGTLTRSSQGGSPDAANAIRFEDKAGAEQLWLHAQKDQLTEVENDETKWVGNDRTKTIDGNETSTIHKNRTETVDMAETITIGGSRTRTVKGSDTVLVGASKSDSATTTYTMEAGQQIRLVCGESVIELNASGQVNLTCKAFNITASESGQINTLAQILDLNMPGGGAGTAPGGEGQQGTIRGKVDAQFPPEA